MSDDLTIPLTQRLRTVSDMIHMGEKIAWGSETALMDEAADTLEAAMQREADKDFIIKNLEDNLVYVRTEGEKALQREAALVEALEMVQIMYPDTLLLLREMLFFSGIQAGDRLPVV